MAILEPEKSRCEKNQKWIVSQENNREHRADNREHQYEVRQYHLDGELIHQEKCCDFLLLNDSKKKAYYIELKGRNVREAVSQLEAAQNKLKSELAGYSVYYRIVGSRMNTHEIDSTEVRKLKERYKGHLLYRSIRIEEEL